MLTERAVHEALITEKGQMHAAQLDHNLGTSEHRRGLVDLCHPDR
jgi:hypothetical protein